MKSFNTKSAKKIKDAKFLNLNFFAPCEPWHRLPREPRGMHVKDFELVKFRIK